MKKLGILIATGGYRISKFKELIKSTIDIFQRSPKSQRDQIKIYINFNTRYVEPVNTQILNHIEKLNTLIEVDISYEHFSGEWYRWYEYLYRKADTEYIYYLEDDDQLRTDFSFIFKTDCPADCIIDYFYGLYKHHEDMEPNFNLSEFLLPFKRNLSHKDLFKIYYKPEIFTYFQLSQIVIRKEIIKHFPTNSNIYNDYILFKYNPGNIKYIKQYFFSQGYDGLNISLKRK